MKKIVLAALIVAAGYALASAEHKPADQGRLEAAKSLTLVREGKSHEPVSDMDVVNDYLVGTGRSIEDFGITAAEFQHLQEKVYLPAVRSLVEGIASSNQLVYDMLQLRRYLNFAKKSPKELGIDLQKTYQVGAKALAQRWLEPVRQGQSTMPEVDIYWAVRTLIEANVDPSKVASQQEIAVYNSYHK